MKPQHTQFFTDLIAHTGNFNNVTWMGRPIWQNIFDIWITQEIIFQIKPTLIIETGTNRGGSAMFYADLFDLMGQGKIITSDIQPLHNHTHPRIQFLIGSSTNHIVTKICQQAAQESPGPVMVILDSDHSKDHVFNEMNIYGPLVTKDSYMLVQDGAADTIPCLNAGPGPLQAIQQWLPNHPEFTINHELSNKYIISHHPSGWLKRT